MANVRQLSPEELGRLKDLEAKFAAGVTMAALATRDDADMAVRLALGASCAFQVGIALGLDHPNCARYFAQTKDTPVSRRSVETIVADLVADLERKVLEGKPR